MSLLAVVKLALMQFYGYLALGLILMRSIG